MEKKCYSSTSADTEKYLKALNALGNEQVKTSQLQSRVDSLIEELNRNYVLLDEIMAKAELL